MIALGNDIIDLRELPKNGEKYYERLVTYSLVQSEKDFLLNKRLHQNLTLRLLWAVKEAAYKSSMKLGNRDRFIPSSFIVNSLEVEDGHISGKASWNHSRLIFSGKITPEFVHVISQTGETNVALFEQESSHNHSESVRILALKNVSGSEWSVKKNRDGIPFLQQSNDKKLEVSFSHHAGFVACAITF